MRVTPQLTWAARALPGRAEQPTEEACLVAASEVPEATGGRGGPWKRAAPTALGPGQAVPRGLAFFACWTCFIFAVKTAARAGPGAPDVLCWSSTRQ